MAGIDRQRWAQLSPLLDELLDADDGVRVARLAHIRDTDSDLADDLSALLHRQSAIEEQGFLEGVATPLPTEPTLAGRTVGSYTLERSLGRGGMGAVWLAHRSDGRYAGSVAIKLLNLSLLGRAGTERFKREGSALVDGLQGELAPRNLACRRHDVDQGHRIEPGFGEAGERVRESRPRYRREDPGLARDAGVAVRHEGRGHLVRRHHGPKATVLQRLEGLDRLGARQPECELGALLAQRAPEPVGGRARHLSVPSLAATRPPRAMRG